MSIVDLLRAFRACMKAGEHFPMIDEERIVVIHHDGFYYAYQSVDSDTDMAICKAFVHQIEKESGISDWFNVVEMGDISKKKGDGLPKHIQTFGGRVESRTFFILRKEEG